MSQFITDIEPYRQDGDLAAPEYARALYDYPGSSASDLALSAGDCITVLQKGDSGWWRGVKACGAVGFFPGDYVEPVSEAAAGRVQCPSCKTKYQVIALYPFAATDTTSLSFQEDDVLDVIEDQLPDWYNAKLPDGAVGLVPKTYFETYNPDDYEDEGETAARTPARPLPPPAAAKPGPPRPPPAKAKPSMAAPSKSGPPRPPAPKQTPSAGGEYMDLGSATPSSAEYLEVGDAVSPAGLQAEVEALEKELAGLEQAKAAQQKRINELRADMGKHSITKDKSRRELEAMQGRIRQIVALCDEAQ